MGNKTVKKGKTGTAIALAAILIFAGFAVFNYVKFQTRKKVEIETTEEVPVQVAESKVMNLKSILEQTGDIRPMVEVDIYPKVDGKIVEKLLVEKGDFVKKGAVVAVLEDDTIKGQVQEAGAVLESAKANLKQIEANLIPLDQGNRVAGYPFGPRQPCCRISLNAGFLWILDRGNRVAGFLLDRGNRVAGYDATILQEFFLCQKKFIKLIIMYHPIFIVPGQSTSLRHQHTNPSGY